MDDATDELVYLFLASPSKKDEAAQTLLGWYVLRLQSLPRFRLVALAAKIEPPPIDHTQVFDGTPLDQREPEQLIQMLYEQQVDYLQSLRIDDFARLFADFNRQMDESS